MRLNDWKQGLWKAATRLPFPLAYRLIAARHVRRAQGRASELAREGMGTPLSARHATSWRTSDTLFVLGSGASINELTTDQWQEISRANSIGFNFWPLHEFVPTFYAFEEPNDEDQARLLYRVLEARAGAYRDTRIIAKTLTKFTGRGFPSSLRDNLYLSADYSIPVDDEASLRRALAYLKQRGLLDRPEAIEAIPFKRASVSYMLFWALFAGYRRVVLCGVDLNHARYFFEEEPDRYPAELVPDTGQTGEVHLTLDPLVEQLTIDRIVYTTDEVVLKPAGVELFVGSRSSALYPVLPCHFDATPDAVTGASTREAVR